MQTQRLKPRRTFGQCSRKLALAPPVQKMAGGVDKGGGDPSGRHPSGRAPPKRQGARGDRAPLRHEALDLADREVPCNRRGRARANDASWANAGARHGASSAGLPGAALLPYDRHRPIPLNAPGCGRNRDIDCASRQNVSTRTFSGRCFRIGHEGSSMWSRTLQRTRSSRIVCCKSLLGGFCKLSPRWNRTLERGRHGNDVCRCRLPRTS